MSTVWWVCLDHGGCRRGQHSHLWISQCIVDIWASLQLTRPLQSPDCPVQFHTHPAADRDCFGACLLCNFLSLLLPSKAKLWCGSLISTSSCRGHHHILHGSQLLCWGPESTSMFSDRIVLWLCSSLPFRKQIHAQTVHYWKCAVFTEKLEIFSC